MKYIIMCGGDYPNWETPRQLQAVKGEPIVARTIRLLKENGVTDIAISSTNDAFKKFGVLLLRHDNQFGTDGIWSGRWLDCFYPIDSPVCYIFGDVVFSDDAIKTIVETDTEDIEFFASAPPFAVGYPKNWAEPFAFKVRDTHLFRSCIDVARHYDRLHLFTRGIGATAWELWQVIKGNGLNNIDYTNYVAINDWTCDCDNAEDVALIESVME